MKHEKSLSGNSPARQFGWGIVGTGTIARQFVDDLQQIASARVAAVCSRSRASAEQFMPAMSAARRYTTLSAMLTDETIDALYIATPNSFHAEQALEALAARKAVLVEKPLATTSKDAVRIAELAAKQHCFAMEAMWTRFLPAFSAVRDTISAGVIGEIVRIEAELAYMHAEAAGGRFFDPKLGGGSALDLGVYPLSLTVMLLGAPTRIEGRWRAARSGVDISCLFELSFAGGNAQLSCGFDRNGANTFTIFGSRGAICIQEPFLKAQRIIVFDGSVQGLPLIGARATGKAARLLNHLPMPGRRMRGYRFAGNGLQFEALAVMEAVRRGARQSSIMPLIDSIAVLEIMETVLARPPERV